MVYCVRHTAYGCSCGRSGFYHINSELIVAFYNFDIHHTWNFQSKLSPGLSFLTQGHCRKNLLVLSYKKCGQILFSGQGDIEKHFSWITNRKSNCLTKCDQFLPSFEQLSRVLSVLSMETLFYWENLKWLKRQMSWNWRRDKKVDWQSRCHWCRNICQKRFSSRVTLRARSSLNW